MGRQLPNVENHWPKLHCVKGRIYNYFIRHNLFYLETAIEKGNIPNEIRLMKNIAWK